MKRKSAWLSFAACALMAAQPVKAADEKPALVEKPAPLKAADFSQVQVVTFSGNGQIGFFDRATGTLYIYDSSLSKCISIKKIKTLGAPAETLKQ